MAREFWEVCILFLFLIFDLAEKKVMRLGLGGKKNPPQKVMAQKFGFKRKGYGVWRFVFEKNKRTFWVGI